MTATRFPVEESHILMFARAVMDNNPVFTDRDSDAAKAAGGVLAPPTFVMASSQFDPDATLRPKPDELWFGSGREAAGYRRVGNGVLHAEQSFEYHQPLKAGVVLIPSEHDGKSWEKESKKSGKLIFSERIMEFRDEATGELVVTMRMVTVQPERVG